MLADQARADLSAGGQYPSVRSGKLRNAVTLSAYDPGQVAKDEYVVRVGLKKEAYYGAILFKKGWKGLADTMVRIRRELMKVIERGR